MIPNFFCAGPAALVAMPPPIVSQAAVPPRHALLPPTGATACLRNGHALTAAGDLAAALGWFDEALRLDGGLGIAHLCRALCLLQCDRDDEAHEALQAALSCGTEPATVHIHLARLHARHGDGGGALAHLAPALASEPHRAARVADDDAFRSLHDHPQFLQMVGRL